MNLFAEFDPAIIPLLLGIAVITVVLLRLSFRRYRRLGGGAKNQPVLEKVPRYNPGKQGASMIPPVEKARWEGEMCEIARETSARLDSKMAALTELIRQADEAAARLEKANRQAAERENG